MTVGDGGVWFPIRNLMGVMFSVGTAEELYFFFLGGGGAGGKQMFL